MKDTEKLAFNDNGGVMTNNSYLESEAKSSLLSQLCFITLESLIEGLRELNIIVWNSNTLSHDDFIGSGK
ncbi:hypothetical protein CTI12_AA619050 [Artemisia annua]|uniref:Uncharacterized protein n=1 Tax=Artemisia annua TaxID=35608 RepID=A0A2U1KCF8_ARTAN|nr:hypothetical protein CTI12_AA619050 [Artemisia annua]